MHTANLFPVSAIEWAARASGAAIRNAEPLTGGTSSLVIGLETSVGEFVLRLFTKKDWLEEEPDLARHEAWALQRAAEADIPTPELIAFDETGEEAGLPAVLMTRLPGKVLLRPDNIDHWLAGMAEALVPIHALSADEGSWSYSPISISRPLRRRRGRPIRRHGKGRSRSPKDLRRTPMLASSTATITRTM